MIAALLPRIRSFRLTVERIEGVTKLSQAQPAADRRSVIDHLLQRNGDGDAAIARLMAELSVAR
jgi:transcriptional regulator